jgi:hypothetical protein
MFTYATIIKLRKNKKHSYFTYCRPLYVVLSKLHEKFASINLIHHLAAEVRHIILGKSDISITTKELSIHA